MCSCIILVVALFMDIHNTFLRGAQDCTCTGDAAQGPRTLEDSCLNGVGEMNEEDASLEEVFSHLVLNKKDKSVKDRKRAKSLPIRHGRAALLQIPDSCRKKVQFADALGLDLASVKHYSVSDDFQSLTAPSTHEEHHADTCTSNVNLSRFVPAFRAPVESGVFDTRLEHCRVALEKLNLSHFDIRGLIRVLTSSWCRRDVGVRYSFNDWLSFVDVQATPTPAEDSALLGERFEFTLYTPPFLEVGSSVHFAIFCKTEHGEYWDNNEGQNYTLWIPCIQKTDGLNTV